MLYERAMAALPHLVARCPRSSASFGVISGRFYFVTIWFASVLAAGTDAGINNYMF
jgi:hypothetical protein